MCIYVAEFIDTVEQLLLHLCYTVIQLSFMLKGFLKLLGGGGGGGNPLAPLVSATDCNRGDQYCV
jgi:hypothetical protein